MMVIVLAVEFTSDEKHKTKHDIKIQKRNSYFFSVSCSELITINEDLNSIMPLIQGNEFYIFSNSRSSILYLDNWHRWGGGDYSRQLTILG